MSIISQVELHVYKTVIVYGVKILYRNEQPGL